MTINQPYNLNYPYACTSSRNNVNCYFVLEVSRYELLVNFGDGVFGPPKGLRRGLTSLMVGVPLIFNGAFLQLLAVTHPFGYCAEGLDLTRV